MSELTLTRDERLALRARAHHLKPVVLLGAAGLTEAVLKEADRALTAHELIKIRLQGDDREARESTALQIAEHLGAARVQIIGKLLVLYRPRPDEEASTLGPRKPPAPRGSGPRPSPRSSAVPSRKRGRPHNGRALPRRGSERGR